MRTLVTIAIAFAVLVTTCAPALAHEIRPAYLQIREIESSTYDVLWKTPAQGDMRLALNAVMPTSCRNLGVTRGTLVNAAAIEQQRIVCEGGIAGRRIVFENLATTLTDVIVRFEPLSGAPRLLRVTGATPFVEIPTQQSVFAIAASYFSFGVEHILLGFDHLLFVLCLLMLIDERKSLLLAITAFTLAHSLTLAGTTFGWLRFASAPVEASIALSIAFLAAEIVKQRAGRTRSTQLHPEIAAFGFGLLHGFGFASALQDIGMPEDALPLALVSFNLGVETGQIVFVTAVLALTGLWQRYVRALPLSLYRASAYMAGVTASFWFIERSVRIVL
ncbi:HupE/UreJ family protein [Steroidobacter sp. S1-65]|uniref:HupE/UreJ family protein n=1 Tax=Steroidobacter gossypii TaxID=2805490 RepID=A0ABS1X061_9GAMM|nr:HupE/UreJ family protein [Steroidobacter gossypii]MBM0106589.1 HupE/UreJ family protein [Steroidobacter gossypii]